VRSKIPLMASDSRSAQRLLEELKASVRRIPQPRYRTAPLLHAELLHRDRENALIIARIKEVQWRIMYYSLLLYAAVASLPTLGGLNACPTGWKALFTTIEVVLLAAIAYVTVAMIRKTEDDLSLYREYSRINDTLLSVMTGIQSAAAEVIERGHPEKRGSSDYEKSSWRNRAVFTRWFYTIAVLGGLIACAVGVFRLWT
jgi:hypothetical protein